MTAVDMWAVAAAMVAAIALGLRSEMLKPDLSGFHAAPSAVHLTLALSSITLGARVITIVNGAHAQAAEAMVYTTQALAAAILLWNLYRQRPPAPANLDAIG